MNYIEAELSMYQNEICFFLMQASEYQPAAGMLNSFIPIRSAIGIREIYKVQFATLLNFEFHE